MARILVIDDEKNIRKMMRITLEKAGHTVELAEDGERGIELFGDGCGWDLTMTDQRMPGLAGSEVTREVRRRDPAARIVMMTSFATPELASEIMKLGATDFLRKPFTTDMLRDTVAVALERPRDASFVAIPQPAPNGHNGRHPSPNLQKTPPISYYFNGFTYWPIAVSVQEEQSYHNMVVLRAFQVRSPVMTSAKCVVGITSHVQKYIRDEVGSEVADTDSIWDSVCESTIANFLLERAELPPTLLPLYDLTSKQLADIRWMLQS